MAIRLAVLVLGIAAFAANARASDLSLTLSVSSQKLKPGDQVTFTFVYANTSHHDIGISPEYRTYEALDLQLTKLGSKEPTKFIPYLMIGFDPTAISRDYHILSPGATYVRKLHADISSSLPSFGPTLDRSTGLYVLFSGSAIRLPGPGQYEVKTRHRATEAQRKYLNDTAGSQFWVGDVISAPIKVEFRNN